MKKYFIYTILFALVATISFTGCKETETGGEEAVAYETLTSYLTANDMDMGKILTNADGAKFVMGAPEDGDLSAKYIMDIRSATDFAAAHIDGAHNVAFTDILTAAASADKPIIVVCYTGQTACYATSLLRLYGYSDAQALKWGMSGWNADLDKWTANCKDLKDDATNWTYSATDAGSFSAPTISSSTTDGAALLKERVEAVVAGGFKALNGSDVLANPSGYYINNFFSEAHYSGFGHITGAVRVNPLSIAECSKLDPGSQVVTYCYTGQTSAVLTAYLNVLGFDAYSLKFGVNGMTTTNSFWTDGGVTNHWGYDSNPKSLTTVSN